MGDYRDYDNYGPMIVSPDYDESGEFTYYANPLWDNDRQAISYSYDSNLLFRFYQITFDRINNGF